MSTASNTGPVNIEEAKAQLAAAQAAAAIAEAIDAYQAAGYRSLALDPLYDALATVNFSIRQAKRSTS
ncbi:hypothetical protein D3C87_1448190 [compost metagenome]